MSRDFQIWQYRVSHGELLVRSPKDAASVRNMDLVFVGVEYVDLPRFLSNVRVDEPLEDDLLRARERLGKVVERQNLIVLATSTHRYLVVAAAVAVTESEMDIFDSPFD